MAMIALTIFAVLAGRTLAYPLDFGGFGNNWGDGRYDWDYGGGHWGGREGNWGIGGGNWGFGGIGYPGSTSFARENYVRPYNRGGSEFGTRNEVNYSPGYSGAPYSTFYNQYNPYNAYGGTWGVGGGNWGVGGGDWGVHGIGYPGSTGFARENYVRPSNRGGPEFGTRNVVNYRPGYSGAPYSPFYNQYNPYNAYGDTWGVGGGNWGVGGGDWGFGGGNWGFGVGDWTFGGGGWGFGGGDWSFDGGNWGLGGGDWGFGGGNWGFGGIGYPGSTSFSRENYVRPSNRGGPEFGTRNEANYRPGYSGVPYSPLYNQYNPYNAYGGNWGVSGGNWGFDGVGYPGSTSFARENYVRPSNRGGPEFGTRNEVNYRPGYSGVPYSPFFNQYNPYNAYGNNWGFGGVGYPGSTNFARENYVRPSNKGGPEFGTRNEVNYRPGYLDAPYSPFYNQYNPYNAYGNNWGVGGGNWGFGGGY